MDPFYLVRQEIQDGLRDLQPRLARFHALPARSPERRAVAEAGHRQAEALAAQATELSRAVEAAAADPARFGLAAEEVAGRRRWAASAVAQLEGALGALRAAAASEGDARQQQGGGGAAGAAVDGGGGGGGDKAAAALAGAGGGAGGQLDARQQLLVARQDAQLDDVEQGLARLARVGVAMRDELQEQEGMLDALGGEVDGARALSLFFLSFLRLRRSLEARVSRSLEARASRLAHPAPFRLRRRPLCGALSRWPFRVSPRRCCRRCQPADHHTRPSNKPTHTNDPQTQQQKQNRRLGGVAKKVASVVARGGGPGGRQLALIAVLMLVLVALVVLVAV